MSKKIKGELPKGVISKRGVKLIKKDQGNLREYRFKIDAYTPQTMPLNRLAEYLTDLAVLFGENNSVHLIEVEEGSTVLPLIVDREAEPKVLENLDAVARKDAPPERMRAAETIDERLRKDNAKGGIVAPAGDNLIFFPGRERIIPPTYGPFNQPGFIIGTPNLVGGKNDPVPVHIEDMQGVVHVCSAKRGVARDIAPFLFETVIRAEGMARWVRHPTGEWEMKNFNILSVRPVSDAPLRQSVQRLRALPGKWKELEDPLGELMSIRHGTDG
jgi:hypothetical protein